MTTLRPCVQKQRSDGYYPVYIRVIHNRQSAFIKTDKLVDRKGVSKTKEIRDNVVLSYCTNLICEYNKILNLQDTSAWSVQEVITFLTQQQADASFSEYAKLHINRMINSGHERTAKNYKLAVAHLERFIGSNQIMFSHLTSTVLRRWFKDLEKHRRAKEMYPVCVRQIFKAALVELTASTSYGRGAFASNLAKTPSWNMNPAGHNDRLALATATAGIREHRGSAETAQTRDDS